MESARKIKRHVATGCMVGLACLGAMTAGAAAQSRQVPAPTQTGPIVIHSATLHPVSGPVIDRGYLVLEAGKISHIGAGDPPDVRDAQLHDADGLHVYPGLISSDTTLGLTEVGAVQVTHDHTEYGGVTPEVRAAVAINPDSDLIPVARSNGILLAMVTPTGGLVSGRASLVRLDGWTWEQMAIEPAAGLVISWPRTEPINSWWNKKSDAEQLKEIAEQLEKIERVFDDAQAYVKSSDADPTMRSDLRYEAMRPVLAGERPVFIRASSAGQIESAVAWGLRRNLKVVIIGGHQADRVVDLLTAHDIPVIVGGLHRLPSRRHDHYDQPFTLPAKLHEAGVRFCIASGAQAAHERNLNHVAATAVAYGLPKEEALKAVTMNAAAIIGLGEGYGVLEAGSPATCIITSGDPLQITTDTLLAFIDGRRIDLGSRHKSLYQKYQKKYEQLDR